MKFLTLIPIILVCSVSKSSPVRELQLKPMDVGIVHTSIGYSTVVQMPTKPLNVVLGDQASYRVEFINDSVTIKPLRAGATSNLFIFTDKDRFNLTLKTGPATQVDYVVHIHRIFEDPKAAIVLNRHSEHQGLVFTILKVLKSGTAQFVDFEIYNKEKRRKVLKPEDFRFLAQGRVDRISSLYLESSTLEQNQSISGSMSIASAKALLPCNIWVGITNERPVKFSFAQSAHKEGVNALPRMD